MEGPRFEVGPSGRVAQQGDFGGKAEGTLNVFFDSSALAKRYIEEKGSDQVQAILSSASRKLPTEEYRRAKTSVLSDIDDATVIGITEEVIVRAVALLEQFPLRSAAALHVACAAEWSTDVFVSADDRQCTAARAHGVRVEAIRA
jgi:uncharacterized protein